MQQTNASAPGHRSREPRTSIASFDNTDVLYIVASILISHRASHGSCQVYVLNEGLLIIHAGPVASRLVHRDPAGVYERGPEPATLGA